MKNISIDMGENETQKLIESLNKSKNPTHKALLVIANKIDVLNEKMEKERVYTEAKFKEVYNNTRFARQLEKNKKTFMYLGTSLILLAVFGLNAFISYLRKQIGF